MPSEDGTTINMRFIQCLISTCNGLSPVVLMTTGHARLLSEPLHLMPSHVVDTYQFPVTSDDRDIDLPVAMQFCTAHLLTPRCTTITLVHCSVILSLDCSLNTTSDACICQGNGARASAGTHGDGGTETLRRTSHAGKTCETTLGH